MRMVHLKELHTVLIEWDKDENGRFVPKEIPGTEKVWPAQLVLLSMGFLGPEQSDYRAAKFWIRIRVPTLNAAYDKFSYQRLRVSFAAGDCRRGQSLVVWAINEGRGAAREVGWAG